jgi:GTP-dependent phosphoenolpyruvate carboxykinase
MNFQHRLLPSGLSNVLRGPNGVYMSQSVIPDNPKLQAHIADTMALCKAESVYVVDGSKAEFYFGSGYLSQSSLNLEIPKKAKNITYY